MRAIGHYLVKRHHKDADWELAYWGYHSDLVKGHYRFFLYGIEHGYYETDFAEIDEEMKIIVLSDNITKNEQLNRRSIIGGLD